MTEKQVALRLPEDFLERAQALIEPLSNDSSAMLFRVSRAAVLRLAVQRGLQAMENEYGIAEDLGGEDDEVG